MLKSVDKMEEQDGNILDDIEQNGLKKMRMLNKEFLAKNKGSEKVRDYLTKAGSDDALMLIFLRGRKYQPERAWETLKRKAEVRFDEYPEVFAEHPPTFLTNFIESGAWGTLKHRDEHGQRFLCFQGCKWDPSQQSMDDVTMAAVYITEKLLLDKDALENGIVFIQDCEGMGMNHARLYTLPAMLRLLHVFWHACPLKYKAVYFVNVPYYLTFVYGLIKPFLAKKLKERLTLTTSSKKFELLHEKIDPAILPKYLGGELEGHDAFETDIFSKYFN